MARSEESITAMTSYRLPHYGNRSFAVALDDILPYSPSRRQILHVRSGWRLTVSYRDHGVGRQKEPVGVRSTID